MLVAFGVVDGEWLRWPLDHRSRETAGAKRGREEGRTRLWVLKPSCLSTPGPRSTQLARTGGGVGTTASSGQDVTPGSAIPVRTERSGGSNARQTQKLEDERSEPSHLPCLMSSFRWLDCHLPNDSFSDDCTPEGIKQIGLNHRSILFNLSS